MRTAKGLVAKRRCILWMFELRVDRHINKPQSCEGLHYMIIYLIGKKIVGLKNSRLNFFGRKFSQSPIITIVNQGFEIFSQRPKI